MSGIDEVEEEFEIESEKSCIKPGTELDLSVIEWEWVEGELQNERYAESKADLKAFNLKQLVMFVSLAFLTICSSLAVTKVVPIFKIQSAPVPIPEPSHYAPFEVWKNLSFMVVSIRLIF
jgi:hypothetical protein